jgi:rod shape-determining protein MreC
LQIFYRTRKFPARLALLLLITAIVTFSPKIRILFKNSLFAALSKPFEYSSGAKGYLARVGRISTENTALKQELGTLSVTLAILKDAFLENERLKKLLDLEKSLPYKTIAAKVIARDPADWGQAITINKGKKHGIREGMPCAAIRSFIGSVIETAPSSSKIMLINDPNSRVGVIIESSRETALLAGTPQGLCKALYLSLDGKTRKGDKVLTAGFSVQYPKGLAVGNVVATGAEKTGLYKYAIVKPEEDLNEIEEVLCIDTAGR